MFLGQIFRNAQGKTRIQIQSCSEFRWKVMMTKRNKSLKIKIFEREKFGKILKLKWQNNLREQFVFLFEQKKYLFTKYFGLARAEKRS